MDLGIDPIAAVAAADTPATAFLAPPSDDVGGTSGAFTTLMAQGLSGVERDVAAAESAAGAVASGRPVEMHEVMISLEKASLSVQVFMQVRNKLVESYQDLMRMQM